MIGHSERVSCAFAAGAELGPAAGAAPGVTGGIFSAGVDNAAAGIFSNGTAGPGAVARSLSALSLLIGCALPAGGAEESTLPRMMGKPSFPLPMMTTLELVDCESWSVASMPRQRR